MKVISKIYHYKLIIMMTLFLIGVLIASFQSSISSRDGSATISARVVKKSISKNYFESGDLEKNLKIDNVDYNVTYTIDHKLQRDVTKLMKRYRSDYSGVVIIENKTGRILTSLGLKKGRELIPSFPYSSTHPAASLFKIITASDLLSKGIEADKKFSVRGRGTTLYKYQLKNKRTRWSRLIPLKRAFAYSNNVVFGKAAINHVTPLTLYERANRWGFNEVFMKDLDCGMSIFPFAENEYNLAELACGFNRDTSISILHAAVLASVIPNGGLLKIPHIIDTITEKDNSINLWNDSGYSKRAIDEDVAEELGDMMEDTIRIGTARGSFRKMSRSIRNKLIIGGKTGTLTGGIPRGRHDWFTAFVIPKNEAWGEGISIAVLNVNLKKWYIKSAKLARIIITDYYRRISKQ